MYSMCITANCWVVSNHWTQLWTELLDWTDGLDCWTGLMDWIVEQKIDVKSVDEHTVV